MDKQMNRRMDEQNDIERTYKQAEGQTRGQTDRQTDRQPTSQPARQKDRRENGQIDKTTNLIVCSRSWRAEYGNLRCTTSFMAEKIARLRGIKRILKRTFTGVSALTSLILR